MEAGVRLFVPKPYTADAMFDILHKTLHGENENKLM
jgi:hypothetical protein